MKLKTFSVKSWLLACALSLCLAVPVMAAPSLDEITSGTNDTTVESTTEVPTTGNNTSGQTTSGGSVFDNFTVDTDGSDAVTALSEAVNVSGQNETVKKVQQAATGPITIIVQILAYIITMALTIRVVVDLLYIAAPPIRPLLSGGKQGNANNTNQGMGGMNGGLGGGYNSGYGMNNNMSGYGMNRGMNGYGGGMNNQAGGQSALANTCWVTKAALDAAESVDPRTGQAGNPYKLYIKDMTVTLVLTSTLLVLAMTGILQQVGFVIGNIITNALTSIISGGVF